MNQLRDESPRGMRQDKVKKCLSVILKFGTQANYMIKV